MSKSFVSEPLTADAGAPGVANEPQLPPALHWREELLTVKNLRKAWRSTKEDRGDVYLKRHWFEFETGDGRIAVVYFDREARRGQAHWWLYTIETLEEQP